MTNEEAIKYLKQLYPYGGHCWLDEQRIEAIGIAVSAIEFKEKVRAEIEIRKESLKPCGGQGLVVTRLMRELCDDFLSFIDSMQEEEIPPKFPIISQKKCMYTKDDFTDEDRKVLCDGCEEDCEYAQKKEPDTNDVVFQIMLANSLDDNKPIFIKGEEYEDFIRVWRGEREWLGTGTYKVGFGQNCDEPWAKLVSPKMWAEVSEDGLTVTVKEEKAV